MVGNVDHNTCTVHRCYRLILGGMLHGIRMISAATEGKYTQSDFWRKMISNE